MSGISSGKINLRPGTEADSYAVFQVFERSLADLNTRLGVAPSARSSGPDHVARMWAERQPLYEHLARTCDQFWVAEHQGRIVGYARATLRQAVRQLTELFVLPNVQSRGLGRALLERAFPPGEDGQRCIIASPDTRAQALYLKSGVTPRCPLYYFWRTPEQVRLAPEITAQPLSPTPQAVNLLGEIDRRLLGFRRDVDHAWLLEDREGFLYERGGTPVGYGYVGHRSGPFAVAHPEDWAAVLAHAESTAALAGREHFGLEVPTINRPAVEHLLQRSFRLDSFVAIWMSDEPFARLEDYILTSPPFFL